MGFFSKLFGKKEEEPQSQEEERILSEKSISSEHGVEGSEAEEQIEKAEESNCADAEKSEVIKVSLEPNEENFIEVDTDEGTGESVVFESEKGEALLEEEMQMDSTESLSAEVVSIAQAEEMVTESLSNEPLVELESSVEEEPQVKGFFARLKEGLFKTRRNISDKVNTMLAAFTTIDEDLFEELEEILIMADVGVVTTMKIIENLRNRVKLERITDPQAIKGLLKEEIAALLGNDDYELGQYSPEIILIIGVNGVGKTTSIGKIANRLRQKGKKVIIAAADTFRAAAIDQLEVWAKRSHVDMIKHPEGGDPAAVIYDAISSAKAKKVDVVLCDTAGRLHNKKNLMAELNKIFRIVDREYPEAHRETWLVLDATTGQNAISQAKLFQEAADITGIVLTKLDGTAKGGIVIAIKSELGIPVKLVGVGEKVDDLQDFKAEDFVNALFE